MKKISLLALFMAVLMLLCSCIEIKPNGGFDDTAKLPTLDSNNEDVMFVRNEVAVVQSNSTRFYIPHQVNSVECVDKFTDGTYNYYYFYLGYLENFPLMYSPIIKHTGADQEYERTLSAQSEKSIENSVSNSVSVTKSTHSDHEFGWESGGSVGLENIAEVSFKSSFKHSWGSEHSQSSTTENTHSVAESWAESSSESFKLNLRSSDPLGEYRYVHYTKKCFVYAVVIYDKSASEFICYDYITLADQDVQNSVFMVEYSANGGFSSDNESKLIFDESLIDNIDVSETLDNRVPSIDSSVIKPIDIPVNKHLCKKDSGYNLDTNGDKNHAKAHDGYDIGHLTLYGCEQKGTESNVFTIKNSTDFAIEYLFVENPHSLPKYRGKQTNVADDDAKSVKDTDIQGEKINMGAYQVKITYKNQRTELYKKSTSQATVFRSRAMPASKGRPSFIGARMRRSRAQA